MTTIDEFKEKIKAGEIFAALTLAMSEAIELKVTTALSPTDANQPEGNSYLRTSINIVEGKIENEVGSDLIGNDSYNQLLGFHLEQVKEGKQILLHNLESLQRMFIMLNNTLSQLPPTTEKTALFSVEE